MASLSLSCNTSQAAEALLTRARMLSNNAYERARSPTSFAEGESHRLHSSNDHTHRSSYNNARGDSCRRESFNIQQRRGRAATNSSTSSTPPSPSSFVAAPSREYSRFGAANVSSSEKGEPFHTSAAAMVRSPLESSSEWLDCNALVANALLDKSSAHAPPCATTGSPSLSSHPRAPACEGGRDSSPNATTAGDGTAKDPQQRRLSESGSSLVYGVLAALRQSTGLESPTLQVTAKSAASPISPMIASEEDQMVKCPPKTSAAVTPGPTLESSQSAPSPLPDVTRAADPETLELEAASPAVMDETNIKDTLPTAVPDAQPMAVSPVSTTFLSSDKSAESADSEKKDAKEGGKGTTNLLHKMRARKNSFLEHSAIYSAIATTGVQDSSDTNGIKSHTSHLSAQSKGTKRSTKLLGKLMPKFLHTSFSPTQSTSSLSPLSQSAGLSPLSTRSSRSGSMVDQSPLTGKEGMASAETVAAATPTPTMPGSIAVSIKGSQESLPLGPTPEEIEDSSVLMATTAPEYLESLRSSSPASLSLGRRSSCSSDTSKRSDNSLSSKPSGSSMSSVDPVEEVAEESIGLKGQKSFCSVEITYEDVEAEDDDEEVDRSGAHKTGVIPSEEPTSPYIIDETCDDEFFLNSVLRKKSNSSLNTEERPEMPSPMTPNTTMGSDQSGATTPSLSSWSNASSRTSTPSPVSPFPQGDQAYFSSMNSKTSTMHTQYRSNPLPSPVNSGLDEKRSRLREAVSEWRRSANASL